MKSGGIINHCSLKDEGVKATTPVIHLSLEQQVPPWSREGSHPDREENPSEVNQNESMKSDFSF